MNVDKFRSFFLERGFTQNERVIPTPTGPLKEFLLRDPKTMRDLVVCSVKGFVVDSRDKANAKRLMDLAYDAFEMVYGESYQTLILNIHVISNLVVFLKNGLKILASTIEKDRLGRVKKILGAPDLIIRSFGVRWGSREKEEGETNMVISPLLTPDGRLVKDRFTVTIEYFGSDIDKGVSFINGIDVLAKKFILSLVK